MPAIKDRLHLLHFEEVGAGLWQRVTPLTNVMVSVHYAEAIVLDGNASKAAVYGYTQDPDLLEVLITSAAAQQMLAIMSEKKSLEKVVQI